MANRKLRAKPVMRSGRYQIRLRDKWQDLHTTNQDEAVSRAEELKVQLSNGEAPALENMNWVQAWTYCMTLLLEDKRGQWADYEEAKRRMTTFTLAIASVPVQKLTLPMFQRALDGACRVEGRDGATVAKIKPHVLYTFKRLRHVGIASTRWEQDLLWKAAPKPEDSLPHATLNAEELENYLRYEGLGASLFMRCAVGIAYDVVNVRQGDLRLLTWESLGAPTFESVVVGNAKLRRKDDRVGRSTEFVRDLLARFYAEEKNKCAIKGAPLSAHPFTLGKSYWARKLRKEVAASMNITLGHGDNASYCKNSRKPESGKHSFPPKEEWSERERELFLGSTERQQLRFHSSRTDFNARLAEVVTDPRQREKMTAQTAKTVDRNYSQKKQIDATQPQPVVKRRKPPVLSICADKN